MTPSRTIRRTYTFTVSGRGLFPFDMLRYDRCWPKSQVDSHAITATTQPGAHRVTAEIVLEGPQTPTEARWGSFGWEVESVE